MGVERMADRTVVEPNPLTELVTLDVRIGDVIVIARGNGVAEVFERMWTSTTWSRVDIQRLDGIWDRVVLTFFREPKELVGIPSPCNFVKMPSRGGLNAKR